MSQPTNISISSRKGSRDGGSHPVCRWPSSVRRRRGFTLIELLVSISIIGILAGLALGGMYSANVAAKRANTRTTIMKVNAQIMEIWGSYQSRTLPMNPAVFMQPTSNAAGSPYYVQWNAATGNDSRFSPGWLSYYQTMRTSIYTSTSGGSSVPTVFFPDPKAPPGNFGMNPNNNMQVAVLRLAATHELTRLELPCQFSDFTSSTSGNPANAAPVRTLLIPQALDASGNPIANPGGLSQQYLTFFKTNATTFNTDYQSAECLYMILKFATQNEFGQKSITDDPRLVGDVDADGMPEIQDAFNSSTFSPGIPGSPYTQHNMPISFIRWPVGFISDLQPGPSQALSSLSGWQPTVQYAGTRHDLADPLRIDPRAFLMTPLVYSAGKSSSAQQPYSDYDIWEGHSYVGLSASEKLFAQNDPYYTESSGGTPTPIFPVTGNASLDPLPGTQMDPGTNWSGGQIGSGAYADNITNHSLNTRSQ
ncbi:MAG TPA: type II secretion system protein [Pirellulales bacterium]|nr:type II secretion system protein [Pirellulales bacterium]